MNITIHWTMGTNFRDVGERGKSFKNRHGEKSGCLRQSVSIVMPDKIDRRWKQALKQKLAAKIFRKDSTCYVNVNNLYFSLCSIQNLDNFVYKLTAYILEKRRKMVYGHVAEAGILSPIK